MGATFRVGQDSEISFEELPIDMTHSNELRAYQSAQFVPVVSVVAIVPLSRVRYESYGTFWWK